MRVELTDAGQRAAKDVAAVLFDYLRLLKAPGAISKEVRVWGVCGVCVACVERVFVGARVWGVVLLGFDRGLVDVFVG